MAFRLFEKAKLLQQKFCLAGGIIKYLDKFVSFVAVVWWHIDAGDTPVAKIFAIKEDNCLVFFQFEHSPKIF